MLFTSGLAYTAIDARDEARDHDASRGIDRLPCRRFCVRSGTRGSPRLLDAVGARALEYFEKRDKSEHIDEALTQQWKALTLMGEIATAGRFGRRAAALSPGVGRDRRGAAPRHRLHSACSICPKCLYVGSIDLERGRVNQAAEQFHEYRRLANRMIAADPDNSKWRLEGAYAAYNLGIVQLEQARYPQAAQTFQGLVSTMDLLTAAAPGNREYQDLMQESLAYHADALDRAGKIDLAIQQRDRQLTLLAPFLAQAHPDSELQRNAMIANRALAHLRFRKGETTAGLDHVSAAVAIARRLFELEPSNADWMGQNANILSTMHYGIASWREC